MLALVLLPLMDLQEDPGAGAVDLVDALEIEHDEADAVPDGAVDPGREVLGGAEEDRPFEVQDQDLPAVPLQELAMPGIARAPRVDHVAVVGAAHDGFAHPEEER